MQGNLERKFAARGTKPLGLRGQVGLEKYTKNDKNIGFHLKKSNVLGPFGLVDVKAILMIVYINQKQEIIFVTLFIKTKVGFR